MKKKDKVEEVVVEPDYAKLWVTLLRTGIKQRFSQLRREFFMKIASDGKRLYRGYDDLNRIIMHSKVFELLEERHPEVKDHVKLEISPEDTFKHYAYATADDGIYIEYFVNVDKGMTPEAISTIIGKEMVGELDALCSSYEAELSLLKLVPDEELEDDASIIDKSTTITKRTTVHLILLGEGTVDENGEKTINPDNYPNIIKHELTHACLFELRVMMKNGIGTVSRIPASWTDDEILIWNSDLAELEKILTDKTTKEAMFFREFVSEFLMYESDGQTKSANPIEESRVPKTSKPDAKPRVTYRTMSPLDRFEEDMERYDDEYQKAYQKIVDVLRPLYDEYDKLLDDCKMG